MPAQTRSGAKASSRKTTAEAVSSDTEGVSHAALNPSTEFGQPSDRVLKQWKWQVVELQKAFTLGSRSLKSCPKMFYRNVLI